MTSEISVPVSIGELFDKITILEIKSERLVDAAKLVNVNHELALLRAIAAPIATAHAKNLPGLLSSLKQVNMDIWEAEDQIRDFERHQNFADGFLAVARSIYRLNDARATAKREINTLTNSSVIEEKSYASY